MGAFEVFWENNAQTTTHKQFTNNVQIDVKQQKCHNKNAIKAPLV